MRRLFARVREAVRARLCPGYDASFEEAARKAERPEFSAAEFEDVARRGLAQFRVLEARLWSVTSDRDYWRRQVLKNR